MSHPVIRIALLALALAAPAGAPRAEIPAGIGPDDLVAMEILRGWRTASGTVMSGLRLRLAPGWKTYWRAPGEAGIPPRFDWAGSDNLAGAGFHWPVPEVFATSGMRSIGYRDEVVIPMEITPEHEDAPIRLSGNVELGICEDICVPVTIGFDAEVAVGTRRDPAIVAALVDQPRAAAEAGVGRVDCRFAPSARGVMVTAEVDLPAFGPDETVVIESGAPDQWVSEAVSTRDGDRLTARAEIVATGAAPLALERDAMRLTVLAGGEAVEIRGCPAA